MTSHKPVSINVKSEYLKDHSEPLANRHVFAYTDTAIPLFMLSRPGALH